MGTGIRARLRVGDQSNGSLVERFAETLVVDEKERFVFLDRAADRNAELISLERRRGRSRIEEVARVKCVVSQKLINRTVPLIRTRLRNDGDLATGLLAIFRAVRVTHEIELAHTVNAQQLAARAAGGHVVFRRARCTRCR